jgi:cell division protein FtsQ
VRTARDRADASTDAPDGNGVVSLHRRGAAERPAGDRRPWRRAVVIGLVLTIIVVGAWALLGSSLLVVRHVRVIGADLLVPAATVRSAAGIRPGTPLARVDTAAAASRVERLAPVLSARVTRSFPDTVVITVRQRTPALAVAGPGGYALVDSAGVTVSTAAQPPAGLPVLMTPPPVLRDSPVVRVAATVVLSLPAWLRDRVRSVSGSASAVTLRLLSGATVAWGGPGQTDRKVAELNMLLTTPARAYDVSDPAGAVTQG